MLHMTVDSSQVGLFVTHQGVHGKLTVLGKGRLTAGTQPASQTIQRDYNIEIPETIEFGVSDPKRPAYPSHDPLSPDVEFGKNFDG